MLGLGLRLLFLRHPNPIEGDPLLYANIARNLLVHGVYSFSPVAGSEPAVPVPTLIRLPGYPLFLAGCFRVFGLMNFGGGAAGCRLRWTWQDVLGAGAAGWRGCLG